MDKQVQQILRRPNDPLLLLLTSLASGPKHGYALSKDVEDFAGVTLGPGTLYGAITRLEELGLIEPLEEVQRRRPYRITSSGAQVLREITSEMRRLADVGVARLRLAPGGCAVKRNDVVRRLLRWYPSSWRARYGDEFLVYIEDCLADSALTRRFRLSVALAGVKERCYGSGIVGTRSTPSTQRRTGALTVLVAWSIMVIGGAALEKTAEHFSAALPAGSRALPHLAYDAAAVAGVVGTLMVIVGAGIALPGLRRFLRDEGFSEVRRAFQSAVVASVALVVAAFSLSLWAHHLTSAQRNGANDAYSAAFVALALMVVVSVGLWSRMSVVIASRIHFTARELRWESGLAMGVSLASIVVIASASTWWIQMVLHAPWFLEGTTSGVATSSWSAQLVVTFVPLVLGTLTALWGASRVALTYRPGTIDAR